MAYYNVYKLGTTLPIEVLALKNKSSLNVVFLHLIVGIYITNNFKSIFIQFLKFWFIVNKSLLDMKHICHHNYIIITLNKEFKFFLDLY